MEESQLQMLIAVGPEGRGMPSYGFDRLDEDHLGCRWSCLGEAFRPVINTRNAMSVTVATDGPGLVALLESVQLS